jgi:hypothetical protein
MMDWFEPLLGEPALGRISQLKTNEFCTSRSTPFEPRSLSPADMYGILQLTLWALLFACPVSWRMLALSSSSFSAMLRDSAQKPISPWNAFGG